MALNFKNLRDPKLGLTDKLTFGKFKDCRLCDIIEDHYEYLIWAEKQNFVKFQPEVTSLILEQAHFERWTEPEEPKPEVKYSGNSYNLVIFDELYDDDIPF